MDEKQPPPYGSIPPAPITTQPTVVVQQINGEGLAAAPQNIRKWDTGLCDCFDDFGICCYGFWCGWCMLCGISSDLGEHCCLPCLAPPLAFFGNRLKVRTMYGIQGTMCADACVTQFCFSCALCQLRRQMKTYDELRAKQTTVHIHTQ